MTGFRQHLPILTLAIAICILYWFALGGVGVLSADEPRYAAIGQAMAHSGDWITPKLWGSAWFEKPPLLYWMTAVSAKAGFRLELAGRVPVVLLSLAFLATYFAFLRRQFGAAAASTATLLLATSAGWLAYSSLCLTDVPLSVFFSLAVLVCVSMARSDRSVSTKLALIGAFVGAAVLAKGLLPMALAAPLLWFLRRHWRQWWIGLAALIAVAGPWYWAVYRVNGRVFIDEFFLKHHFARLYSASLQHVQPWYFYGPVLLGIVFPWTPLLGMLSTKALVEDKRLQVFAATALFGFLFFSASLNKLPGYLLPLVPSIFALIGVAIAERGKDRISRGWWLACSILIGAIVILPVALPLVLSGDKLHWSILAAPRLTWLVIAVPVGAAILVPSRWTLEALTLMTVAGGLYLKARVYPELDATVSARSLWLQLEPRRESLCDGGLHRNWQYGLAFYAGHELPKCEQKPTEVRLAQKGNEPPSIVSGTATR